METAKTYKREVAVVQMGVLWALVAFICYLTIDQPTRDLTDLVGLATGMAVWVFGFAGAAFGFDAWAKQVVPRQRRQ